MYKILFFSASLAFSTSLSAQIIPSVKKPNLKSTAVETVAKQDGNLDGQIKTALMKDESLQTKALDYLKSNPETTKSFTGLLSKNKGGNSSLMKSVLGDKKLTATVIDYISNNPKLLKQVTSFFTK